MTDINSLQPVPDRTRLVALVERGEVARTGKQRWDTASNDLMTARRTGPLTIGGVQQSYLSRAAKLLQRILDPAAEQSIPFEGLVGVLGTLGFTQRRGAGSHRVFVRGGIVEILNLQPRKDGTAKPYQLRQVRRVILRYGLHLNLES